MFSFYMPTKILAGENVIRENPNALILGRKAFIVTGKRSGYASGALQDVCDTLMENRVDFVIYDRIENNPDVDSVYAAGRQAFSCSADFIIAIGGGSPLDAAKAAAVYAANDIPPMDIYKGNFAQKPLPIVAIPTTAGTGSEVTPYSILTLHSQGTKRSFTCEDCFPRVAFLDGRYTLDLPLQTARNTAVDAMCHCIEGYLTNRASRSSDYVALKGLNIIGRYIPRLISGSFDTDMCLDMLWASTLGGITISQTSTTIVHSMGYQLTYCRNIPHGMANGLLLGAFLDWCAEAAADRIDDCLNALGMNNIEELKDALNDMLPFKETVSDEEIEDWLKVSMKAKNVNTPPRTVTVEDEREIYKKSLL